jgi:hypothetical protein
MMDLNSVISEVATVTGLDSVAASKATGIILSVIQQEVDPSVASQVFAKLPGATELAQANVVTAGGGMFGGLLGGILGNKVGVLAVGYSALQSTGLSISQIETAGMKLMSYVQANAGPNLANQVASSLPGIMSAR